MLGRELEFRSTEILSAYQVQQGRPGQVQQVQQGQVQQVQGQQVQQVQGQQLQQVHQGRCSIFVNNSKCIKNNEIEWSKDIKIKCGKNTHRTVGRPKQVPNCLVPCGCWVFWCLGFAAETADFRRENWRGREPW